MNATSADSRIPALDGIRGVAILLVMMRHAVDGMITATPVDRAVFQLGRLGSNGVDIFFVLSGFLITGILLDRRGRPDYFRTFYLRRTLRIFPLYYATLLVLVFVVPHFTDPRQWVTMIDLSQTQVWHWTYLSNWHVAMKGYYGAAAHFWSLAVEEQFYFVWPIVVLLAGPRRLAGVCIGALALSVATRIVCVLAGVPIIAVYVMTITRLDPLAIGALLAVIAREPAGLERFRRWYAPVAICAAAILAAMVALQWGRGRTLLIMAAGVLPIAVIAGSVTAASLLDNGQTLAGRMFSNRPLRFFGKYSYCLYIVHPFIYEAVARHYTDTSIAPVFGSYLPGRIVFVAIAVSICVLVALISWHGYEKQWLKLKESPVVTSLLRPRRDAAALETVPVQET